MPGTNTPLSLQSRDVLMNPWKFVVLAPPKSPLKLEISSDSDQGIAGTTKYNQHEPVKFAHLEDSIIAYETFGDSRHPLVLMIMGLGAQMLVWPESLCQFIAEQGYFVVRFDNRDIGLSSKWEQHKPKLVRNYCRSKVGLAISSPYRLEEMAKDSVALIQHLGHTDAHIVGASMGGMIAQIIAANFPHLTRSLSILMSDSGYTGIPAINLKLGLCLLGKSNSSNCAAKQLEHRISLIRAIGSKTYPTCSSLLRDRVEKVMTRNTDDTPGTRRQCTALLATGSLESMQRHIRKSTLVIHGDEDRLIPFQRGLGISQRIQRSRFELVAGMGHDFPPPLIARLGRSISSHLLGSEE